MDRLVKSGLQIDPVLYEFTVTEALQGTGLNEDDFWQGFADLVSELTPINTHLLLRRDELQAQIDQFHKDRPGQVIDPIEYKKFLRSIGYLCEEPTGVFQIETANVDPEISHTAGPQLVVPVLNARFALNAANARWGSLYDAFYGTNVIPEEEGTEQGSSYNPERGNLVIKRTSEELDKVVPLDGLSHADVVDYVIDESADRTQLRALDSKGKQFRLKNPDTFVGYRKERSEAQSILLKNNGLHIEIQVDRDDDIGASHAAGVADVILEAAITTIQDCEDSVAAVDAEDKTNVYRNWLGLMKGDLQSTFEKNGESITRVLAEDRTYQSIDGGEFNLPGRSLLLVRNVGLLMQNDAILDANGEEIYEGIMDAVFTSLCAVHDLNGRSSRRNSKAGSIYIVKPKLHGPEETRFTCDLFDRVEDLLGLSRHTIKIGIMDEERRTSLNLKACIEIAKDRVVFINTGFLDRTGDEIHTSMYAGSMKRKEAMKAAEWILAYEDRNVDNGLAAGFPGRAQIGKGMWPKPDEMADMMIQKVGHVSAGATCAWVPSPTAATLHALHYHQISVASRQQELEDRCEAKIDNILKVPLTDGENFSVADIRAELDTNVQGILGYVVRWVDQGIGCSKVPDLDDVGLMEDRATCRISSQHIVNWLLHGLVSETQVRESLERMAAVVDSQNADDENYTNMSPNFSDSIAFQAASDLIFRGLEQPNGYTEPILHARRREVKEKLLSAA